MIDLKALLDDIMDCEELNDEKFEVQEKIRRSVASSIKHAFALKFAQHNLRRSLNNRINEISESESSDGEEKKGF